MAIDISYDPDKAFLYIAVKGQATLEEYKTAMKEITQSEQFPANVNTMWDVRNQDFSSVDSSELKTFVKIQKQYPERDTARIAFIVKGDLAFGMMRMYEILSSLEEPDSPQNIKVFRSYSEGEKWLIGEEP